MADKSWFLQVDDGSGRRDATPEETADFKALPPPRVFVEYPKALEDGYIAQHAADEAEHLAAIAPKKPAPPAAEPEPEPEAATPLDDVSVEMDNPAFDAKPKGKAKK